MKVTVSSYAVGSGGRLLAGLTLALLSLQDVLMQDSRLYLIFEFLSMDLKKYLDSIPPGQFMDSSLVKVKSCVLLLIRSLNVGSILAFCGCILENL